MAKKKTTLEEKEDKAIGNMDPNDPNAAKYRKVELTCRPTAILFPKSSSQQSDSDSKFCIVEVRILVHKEREKIGNLIICKGDMLPVDLSSQYEVTGKPEYDERFKKWNLKVESWIPVQVLTTAGLIELLSKEAPGIGPVMAKKLVKEHGIGILDTIREWPALVSIMMGWKDERDEEGNPVGNLRQKALQAWANSRRGDEEFRKQLYALNLGTGLINKIIGHYEIDVMTKVRGDVFGLTQIPGIGFKTACKIADALGVPHRDPGRIQAGVLYALESLCQEQGHTCLHHETLMNHAAELLQVSPNDVLDQLIVLREKKEICFRQNTNSPDDNPMEHSSNPALFKHRYPAEWEAMREQVEQDQSERQERREQQQQRKVHRDNAIRAREAREDREQKKAEREKEVDMPEYTEHALVFDSKQQMERYEQSLADGTDWLPNIESDEDFHIQDQEREQEKGIIDDPNRWSGTEEMLSNMLETMGYPKEEPKLEPKSEQKPEPKKLSSEELDALIAKQSEVIEDDDPEPEEKMWYE